MTTIPDPNPFDESELAEWRAHFPGKSPTQVIEWLAKGSEDRWERTKLIAQMATTLIAADAGKPMNAVQSYDAGHYVRNAQAILSAAEAAESPPSSDAKCVGLRSNHRWGDDGVCLHCGARRPAEAYEKDSK